MNPIRNPYQDSTPSVYFNFDSSNQVIHACKIRKQFKVGMNINMFHMIILSALIKTSTLKTKISMLIKNKNILLHRLHI